MGAERALRIGLMLDTRPMPGPDFTSQARECEDSGFDFAMLHPDHPSSSGKRGTGESLEVWTAATRALAATRRLTVVPAVLGLPYRHPGVVAKMAESLGRLSGGRVVLGLGSGGDDRAAGGFGLTVRTPGQKVRALDEAVQVMRQLWRQDRAPATFRGDHFALHGASINPAPDRPIPIWLGVHAPQGRELVARAANGWLPSSPVLPPEDATAALCSIRAMADDHGRRDAIEYAYNVTVFVGKPALARVQGPAPTFSGHADHIADQLGKLAESGFTVLNLWPMPRTADQPRLLAEQVLPRLRS
jgi:alkanesulfonate monooxygenase SsuD/methylene tetrahydromethanopterin reductase-like flavin-dependent oxidoreductase (luciferase family)